MQGESQPSGAFAPILPWQLGNWKGEGCAKSCCATERFARLVFHLLLVAKLSGCLQLEPEKRGMN